MKHSGYVYILTNQWNAILYVGVTNSLVRRIQEHRESRSSSSFTKKYHVSKLVYFEVADDIRTAIEREKQLKGGSRKNKIQLIQKTNPGWEDLYESILG